MSSHSEYLEEEKLAFLGEKKIIEIEHVYDTYTTDISAHMYHMNIQIILLL